LEKNAKKSEKKERGWKKLLCMKVSKKQKETTDSVDWREIHSV
jgi:hypothetical protein